MREYVRGKNASPTETEPIHISIPHARDGAVYKIQSVGIINVIGWRWRNTFLYAGRKCNNVICFARMPTPISTSARAHTHTHTHTLDSKSSEIGVPTEYTELTFPKCGWRKNDERRGNPIKVHALETYGSRVETARQIRAYTDARCLIRVFSTTRGSARVTRERERNQFKSYIAIL